MANSDPGMAAAAQEELNQLEEVILAKVQQRVPARMSEDIYLLKAFRYHDLQNSGWVEFDKFKRTLAPFTPGVGDQDLRCIYDRYSVDGLICYKQFITEFVSGVRREPELANEEADAAPEGWISPEDTLMRMRSFIYSRGPGGIAALANMLCEADPSNSRALTMETFMMIMSEIFSVNGECQLQDVQLEQLFDCFRNPYQSDTVAYDELMQALKEEVSQDRRTAIRQAFRRLDTGSEGLVDISIMDRCFNANRHPMVSDGSRSADEVHAEFLETLRDVVSYRRGQRSYPTNLVAWEEFEDYYKFISGCYESDQLFCSILNKVWDLDKLPDHSIEARDAMARPAAGIPAKSRAGLHHWQAQTLPAAAEAQRQVAGSNVSTAMQRLRSAIAQRGIRKAVDIVKNFYMADDDVDDEIDKYEFRRACEASGLRLSDAEEAGVFKLCGCGQRDAKIQVTQFLQLLHGELSYSRRQIIERSWRSIGGDPEDMEAMMSPAVLKDRFCCENHPQVQKGEMDPGLVLGEFLDTFSLLAHVRGGCQNGMVSFSDFLAYYSVVSSTVEADALFDLLMNRLWAPMPQPEQEGMPAPPSPRKSVPLLEQQANSPLARGRPPAFDGPSVYNSASQPEDAPPLESYRRYARGDCGYAAEPSMPAGIKQPAAPAFSPITKSSIVFNETASNALGFVIERLRESLSKRGLKGWRSISQRFQQYDNKRNGTVMRLDWERLHKSLGLGLSPEERDAIFKGLSLSRKDGLMDYRQCLRLAHGPLSEPRQEAVHRLYEELRDDDCGGVPAETLKACFQARSSPVVLLGRKDAMSEATDFAEAVDYFSGGTGGFAEEAFMEFFSLVSAIHPDDDEFRLMTTAAFGLRGAGAGSLGGC